MKNEIQKKYVKRLEDLSTELEIEIRYLSNDNNKPYITGKISDYRFWIYDTGDSDFSSEWYDRRFEIYDFKNEEDIVDAFINSLRDAIDRKEYYRKHPDKSPRPILNRLFRRTYNFWKSLKFKK
ncbi:hypothetical protein [Bdellovibrio sp. BCCA]|uniref:hypothetical protein n=1 Tax=Bdellovibrio sp. BCCA TaxID=3136281 RepID=UPI0030F14B71